MSEVRIGNGSCRLFLGSREIVNEESSEENLIMHLPFSISDTNNAYTTLLNDYADKDFTYELWARQTTTATTSAGSPCGIFRNPNGNLWAFGIDLHDNIVKFWENDKIEAVIIHEVHNWSHYAITHKSNGESCVFINGEKKISNSFVISLSMVKQFDITIAQTSTRGIAEVKDFKFYSSIKYESNFCPPSMT